MNPMKEVELSLILERDVSAALDAELIEALVECYPNEAWYFCKRSWWYSRPAWRIIAREKDGPVVGHFAAVLRDVLVGDKKTPVSVAGVQGVFVRQAHRGTELSDRLMARTLEEAGQQNLDAGLLFCIPKLEALYGRMGWHKIDAEASLIGESGERELLSDKDISMVYPLRLKEFPSGDIDLNGNVW